MPSYSIAVDLKNAYGSATVRGGQFVTDKEADGFSSPTIRYQGTLDISDASITRVNTGIKFSRSYPAPTEVEGLTYANLAFTSAANAVGQRHRLPVTKRCARALPARAHPACMRPVSGPARLR